MVGIRGNLIYERNRWTQCGNALQPDPQALQYLFFSWYIKRRTGKTLHFILARGQECDVFQKDIEEEYSLRPPTATKLLKDMEKNGLIYREAVPYDARLKRIVATEKAMQYQELIHQSLEETEDRLTSGISSQDLAVFFRVINQMIRNMS